MSSVCRSLQTSDAPVRSTRPMTLESSFADSAMLKVSCCAAWSSTLPDQAVGRAVRVPGSMSATIALAYPPTEVASRQASTRISRRWRMRTMALLTPDSILSTRVRRLMCFSWRRRSVKSRSLPRKPITWPSSPSNTSMLRSSQR